LAEAHGHCLLLPPEQFYWALLAPPKSGRAQSINGKQLGYLFENVLPVPIEQVQAVYARTSEGKFIACGMDREQLSHHANGHVHLGPATLPNAIDAPIETARLNLLVGEFEPKAITNLRIRWTWSLSAIILACAVVLTVGMHRRTASYQATIADINSVRQDVLAQVLGDSASGGGGGSGGGSGGGGGGQPAELRLTAELRRLRQTRQAPSGADSQLTDVTPLLAELLAAWPSPDVFVRTETISVTPTSITVRGLVPTSDEAQVLATSLESTKSSGADPRSGGGGWSIRQPQITSVRDGVQFVMQLAPIQSTESGKAATP
jgi:hypothetical protein